MTTTERLAFIGVVKKRRAEFLRIRDAAARGEIDLHENHVAVSPEALAARYDEYIRGDDYIIAMVEQLIADDNPMS